MKNSDSFIKQLTEEFLSYEFPSNVVHTSIEVFKDIMRPIVKKDVYGTSYFLAEVEIPKKYRSKK